MTAASLLFALDTEQRAAVTAPADAVIVLAGAGSGKTTVLTRRIAHRIDDGTADAEHTLAITFTREAAAQLRRRSPKGIHSGTFHAIAFALLRQRLADLDKPIPTILTNRFGMMNEASRSIRSRAPIAEALSEYEWMQARALTADSYSDIAAGTRKTQTPIGELVKLYVEYEKMKKLRGVLDIGDLLARATDEINKSVDYRGTVHWRFRHLLVDEAQDMNPQQFAFFEALRGGRRDVFIVGDPLQAIYGWNGADPALFDAMPNKLGGATVVHLRNNYRCSPVIVEAGLHVLNTNGHSASAKSVKLDGEPITITALDDEVQEADTVAELARLAHRGLRRWNDIAVLVRTNALRETIVEGLRRHAIPVSTSASSAVLAPLLQEVAALTNRFALADWSLDLRIATDDNTPEHSLALLVDEFLRDYPSGPANGNMFTSWYNTSASRPGADDGVEILTLHAAKGREWHTVIIAGAEKGLLPHSSARLAMQKAEEVRLAYVAITRAAERLHITWSRVRNGRKSNPSPFIVDLPLGESARAPMPDELVQIARNTHAGTLMGALRAWRRTRAVQLGTTEAAVCADGLLQRIADTQPRSSAQLADLVGPLTAESMGPSLLPVVAGFTGTDSK